MEKLQPGMIPLADITALFEEMYSNADAEPYWYISRETMHAITKAAIIGHRYARLQKLRKRQRRAAQRKHCRG